MAIRYVALPTAQVRALQAGGPDAYGMGPERRISDGDGVPCRHCLQNVRAGTEYLVLAYPAVSATAAICRNGSDFPSRGGMRASS